MKAAQSKIVLLAFACALPGCDRDQLPAPSNHSSKSTTQPQSAAATRPTTQALLHGTRQPLALGVFPLKMDVPDSWHIDSGDGGMQSIVGFSPHGPIKILLMEIATAFSDKTLPLMDKQLSKQAADSRGMIEVKPLRPLGESVAKVREQLERQPNATIERDGRAVQVDVMDWMIDVYVPQEKTYMQYSLHFDSLPLEQYLQDKDFLEKIIATLRYSASKDSLHQ